MSFQSTILFLSMISLSAMSQAQCPQSFEGLQKSLIPQHIARYPYDYGDGLRVLEISTLQCRTSGLSTYQVRYRNTICRDLHDPERDVCRCFQAICESEARVTAQGRVDFELAPLSSCTRAGKDHIRYP